MSNQLATSPRALAILDEKLAREEIARSNVVWAPLWGSQMLALTCPANVILMHGTRGGGKTETQLMAFRRHVGVGYGSFWRGVIFDREYKNLDDIVAKSEKLFPKFGDGAVFLRSAKDYKWVWPTGEELLFRSGSTEQDYESYHGHEYCLPESERVRTARGLVSMIDLVVGDMILTPVGYRRLNRIFDVGVKSCVRVSSYTLDGRLRFSQLQSVDHRLLTSERDWSKSESLTCQKVMRYDGTCGLRGQVHKSPLCGNQVSLDASSLQAGAGIASRGFRNSIRNALGVLFCSSFSTLLSLFLQLDLGRFRRSSTGRRALSVFFLLFAMRKAGRQTTLTGLEPQRAPAEPTPDRSCENFHARSEGDLSGSRKGEGFLSDCSSCPYLCGGPVRTDKEICQCAAPSRPDAQARDLAMPLDDLESEARRSLPSRFVFSHPYEDRQVESILQLSACSVDVVPCGDFRCFDIEVDDVNSYVTESGLVNKNCFIGFNELTKQPTRRFFDAIQSCNRSSFISEVHSPDPNHPLPPIPNIVFCTTNPHGAGHNWVKAEFIDAGAPGEVVRKVTRVYSAKTRREEDIVTTKCHIYSHWRENPYLAEKYAADMANMTDENKRKAWFDGNWHITSGGALDDLWDARYLRRPRFKIPPQWKIDRSFDWGSTQPFSCCWWAEADGSEVEMPNGTWWGPKRGSLIQFAEWFGGTDYISNNGLRLSARNVAIGIREREKKWRKEGWIVADVRPGPADNQIHNQNDAETDSIAKIMGKEGIRWNESDKTPGSRVNGLELMRVRLENAITGDGPGIFFMHNPDGRQNEFGFCLASMTTLPVLQRDASNPDDISSEGVDHVWDSLRYRLLAYARQYPSSIDTRWYGGGQRAR